MVLHQLQRLYNDKFCKFFQEFAEQRPLEEIIDFFHSYMSYCTREDMKSKW